MGSVFKSIICLFFLATIWLSTNNAIAQEAAAVPAAEDILRSFATGKIQDVWDHKTSNYIQKLMTEQAFLSQMSLSHAQLGALSDVKLVSTQHMDHDPGTGQKGDIYLVVFRTVYVAGEFYVQIAVVKDNDGVYRYAGIYGSPVPKQ